jgi:hypothetical protein
MHFSKNPETLLSCLFYSRNDWCFGCNETREVQANAESSQLGRSQRAVGIRGGLEDSDVGELLEQLIPLVVNNLLVAPHNLKALIHHI